MQKQYLLPIIAALAACSPDEPSIEKRMAERKSECTTRKDDQIIFNTAAGFQLSRPSWMADFGDEFNKDCKLISTRFSFAYAHDELIPKPVSGLLHPMHPDLPQNTDKLTLMFKFQDPSSDGPGAPEHNCIANKHIYRLPQIGLQMCASGSSPNITTLPFYPRFEFIDSQDGNPSLTCPHDDIEGRTLTDIQRLSVKNACRGYWTWRPGAHAMFDLGRGEVLKKYRPAIEAAQLTLNSWLVKN